MPVAATAVTEIGLVVIPTADVDRALDFYVGRLGLEKRVDIPMGEDYRWVQVYPPNGVAGIAISPPPPGREVSPKDTGIILNTTDVDAAHAQLREAGVDVDAEITRMGDPVPPMFWIRDPEGNSLMVVQPS